MGRRGTQLRGTDAAAQGAKRVWPRVRGAQDLVVARIVIVCTKHDNTISKTSKGKVKNYLIMYISRNYSL